jgi:hypothetical protein
VENFTSIFENSGIDGLDGTKRWRMAWWDKIIDYTVHGPYFWVGKGFGVNLADVDGFQLIFDPDIPKLRAPHSIFMTVLARSGVPGLSLWGLVCLVWLYCMFRCFFESRARGHRPWERLFLLLPTYWIAILICGSFDPALESPQAGIWFWSLYGIGIGAAQIYRYEVGTNTFGLGRTGVQNCSANSR